MSRSHPVRVPLTDLRIQYSALRPRLERSIRDVLLHDSLIHGRAVETFEKQFAKQIGAGFCIGVGNGTDAITLSLKAIGIGPGDGVVTAANSFIATSEAISLSGAHPQFVDCHFETSLMDLDALEALLTRRRVGGVRIRAIIAVHLYGRALDMTRLSAMARRHNVALIEDCAQAHLATWKGKSVGTFGITGCFSFFPSKNLGAYGDAGGIVTSNRALAETLRMWRNHGRVQKYDHEFEGTNSRLDSLQAAVLNVKLPFLRRWNSLRQRHARLYSRLLGDIPGLTVPDIPSGQAHVFHLYVIRTRERDSLKSWLAQKGIESGIHYPLALPNLKAYRHLNFSVRDFPVASALQNQILSLPMYPELTDAQIRYTARSIREFFNRA